MNNGTLAALRIVNCNRSPNAVISLVMMFRLSEINREKIQLFKQNIERYVQDRRRLYHGLVSLCCNEVSTVEGSVTYGLDVRHRRSWQDYPLIMQTRAELMWYCMKVSQELGIGHDVFVPSVKVINAYEAFDDKKVDQEKKLMDRKDTSTGLEVNPEGGAAAFLLLLSS